MQIKLKDLISKLNNGWYLPSFQRDYVWLNNKKSRKIEKLFDSLMQGYPIGQIVLWQPQNIEKDILAYKFLDHYEIDGQNETGPISIQNSAVDSLVLDGQQRLTSLFISTNSIGYIEDSTGKKYLYMNLLHTPNKESVDSVSFQFEFKTREEAEKKDAEHFWFKVSNIITNNSKNGEEFSKKFTAELFNSKDNPDEIKTETVKKCIEEKLELLWKNVREKEMNYETVKGPFDDSILEIFVRLNDSGVKLEKADLLLSFMESASTLFQPNGARETISKFVDKMNKRLPKKNNAVKTKKDFVLKACLMLTEDLDIRYEVKNFEKANLDKISSNWKSIEKSLTTVYELLDQYNFSEKTVTSSNALLPIAYYLQKNELNKECFVNASDSDYEEKRTMLIKWLSKALLSREFSGSSDTTLKKYRENTNNSPLSIDNSKQLKRNYIEKLVKNSVYQGKNTQLILFLATYAKHGENSQDHIFPQNDFEKETLKPYKKDLMNSIGNLELLTPAENSHKNGMSASDWAKNITEERKKELLYPTDIELTDENFVKFVNERQKLIIDKLCDELGIKNEFENN